MQKVNWFEIPAQDFQRAVRFYETLFDTRLKVENFAGFPMGVFGDGKDAVGCVIQGEDYVPGPHGPVLYLDASPSIDGVIARVEQAGGKLSLEKTALPDGMGYIATLFDTEGNRVALHAMN